MEREEGKFTGRTTEGHKEIFGIIGCDLEGFIAVYMWKLTKLQALREVYLH